MQTTKARFVAAAGGFTHFDSLDCGCAYEIFVSPSIFACKKHWRRMDGIKELMEIKVILETKYCLSDRESNAISEIIKRLQKGRVK